MIKAVIQPAFSRLTTRLILAFIAVVLMTSLVASIPSYWLIQRELDRQAWNQVGNGQQVTQTLLAEEQARLNDLGTLAAQRPTLHRLLKEDNTTALPDYLRILQSGIDVDILILRSPSGHPLFASPEWIAEPEADPQQARGLYVLSRQSEDVFLFATLPVIEDETQRLLGYITLGFILDDDFIQRTARETGFEQSLLINSQRVATSLPQREAEIRSGSTPDAAFSRLLVEQVSYYTATTLIHAGGKEPPIFLETALPVGELESAQQRALGFIALSTGIVAALGSGVGSILARRLTIPLDDLTKAAYKMSKGDLHTALPRPREPAEIATLAVALEESRESIQRALNELTEAKTWSETLLSSIVEGVVTFDTQGKITFFSEGATRITGFEAASILGQSLEAVFHLSDSGGETFLDRIPPRGEMRRLEIIGADGRPMVISISGARMAPPGSDTVQVALVFRDVTEEEAARNLRSQFLANITHEFRTPLAALTASLELLIDEADRMDAPAIHTLAGSLRLSVLYLQTLIDNLLESSSIEAGRFSIRRKTMELNQVLSHAVQVLEPLLTRRQQTLAISQPTRLAPIHADPTRLGQVLVNLLSNASKYSPPGSTIDLRVEATGGSLRIAVLDRGPGIPEVERQNLFRRFVRLDTPEAEQYGIGLGLSVAKVIIEGHGGTIGVDERPGGGSVFWFTLTMGKRNESIGH